MVKFNYLLFIVLLLINCNFIVLSASENSLINLAFNISNLSDEFLFYFQKNAHIIYYSDNNIKNAENIINKEVVFLIPDFSLKDMSKILDFLKNLKVSYELKVEPCTTPLKGIKIIFIYNPEEITLDYGSVRENFTIFFRLYKKGVLNLINEKTNTFRWYAKIDHNFNFSQNFIYV